jgi:DNA-binding response OmpR family regulator
MLALFGWNFDCLQEHVSGSRYTRDRNLGETGLLEITRAGNGVQPKSEGKIRPQHRISAAKEHVTPQSVDQVKPLGRGVRPGHQTQDEISATVVMNSHIRRIEGGSAEPDEDLLDGSLSPLTSVGLKEIHRLARFLPVIVLVPRSRAVDQAVTRKMSVAKPQDKGSDTTSMLGVLGKVVERFKGTGGGSTAAFGDVTVNFSTMETLRKGEPVVLTAREFETLKYFIQNARRVISRDELLNEVWGYENYPCTRTVDNRVLRLRKKLERDPSRPLHFRTIHGAGYKFLP